MGQMMEPVVFPDFIDLADLPKKDWILDGCKDREPRCIYSMILDPATMYAHNLRLMEKYQRMSDNEVRYETYLTDDAEVVIVAYGTASRIAKGAVNRLRREGHKVGLFRPITLYPYPTKPLRALAEQKDKLAVFELSAGQMVEDVIIAVGERAEIHLEAIPGGPIPTPAEVADFVISVKNGDGQRGRRVEV